MRAQDQDDNMRKRVATAAADAGSSQRTVNEFFPGTALKTAANAAVADFF